MGSDGDEGEMAGEVQGVIGWMCVYEGAGTGVASCTRSISKKKWNPASDAEAREHSEADHVIGQRSIAQERREGEYGSTGGKGKR